MMKLHKAIPYVRQRTVESRNAYVRHRTMAATGVALALFVTSCATSNGPKPAAQGLASIQSAITCPAPPEHTAVLNPPRHFTAAPSLVLPRDLGYCAFVDTAAGVISIRLRPEYAPKAVADFIFLARQGFYDGLSFYQTCPATTGASCPAGGTLALAGPTTAAGAGYTVPSDPVVGNYLFGAVAMFGSDPSRIGSQFFISMGDSQTLARRYDIFGQVTDGIPALATLQKGSTIAWIAIVETAPEP
jgi:cyclophilin family peptidyl-prolyl cis-trans isomerase